MVAQAHDIRRLFGRPYEHTRVILGTTGQEEAVGIPLDALKHVLMSLPDLFGLTWRVDVPEVNVRATRSGKLLVILPSYVNDRARLNEHYERLLLDQMRSPNKHISILASRSNKTVSFVPTRDNERVLSTK